MPIKLTLRKQEFLLEGPSIQVKAAFQQLKLSPEAHLMVRNGELLNENDYLKDGDEVKIVAVISGGCSIEGFAIGDHA
jgi:sulfur carrier protein ThiS